MLRSKAGTIIPKTEAENRVIIITVGSMPRIKRLLNNIELPRRRGASKNARFIENQEKYYINNRRLSIEKYARSNH